MENTYKSNNISTNISKDILKIKNKLNGLWNKKVSNISIYKSLDVLEIIEEVMGEPVKHTNSTFFVKISWESSWFLGKIPIVSESTVENLVSTKNYAKF